ncbi:MAG: acetyltransferase [Anaerolineae bacterium]|nr:acetyltransferase [Anaerolineae bacterium]
MSDLTMIPDYVLADFDPTAVLLYGGGGHGKTLLELVRAQRVYRVLGIVDDQMEAGQTVLGTPVVGGADVLPEWHKRGVRLAINGVGGIGSVDTRLKVFETLADAGFSCPVIVHPTAWVEDSAALEGGVQLLAHTYVGSECRVGFGSVLNVGVCLSHDVKTGKVNNFSPGAMLGGNVTLGDYTQVGMNATINLGVNVGSRVRIGNGATIKADVPDGCRIYAGTIYPTRL